ncbi:hypothetical protein I4U23_007316 [Adineta vaga]|nr:hypothetical protein I4U23_007316 [Adineta vaga]
MKKISIVCLVMIGFLAMNWHGVNADDDESFEEDAANANRFLKRTLFHPGSTKCEEQKREAREDYEERCEPSFPLYRNTGTHRFCPDINSWREFENYEIGNGYDGQDPTSTTRYVDRNRYNTINRDGDRRNRPPPIVPDRNNDYEN